MSTGIPMYLAKAIDALSEAITDRDNGSDFEVGYHLRAQGYLSLALAEYEFDPELSIVLGSERESAALMRLADKQLCRLLEIYIAGSEDSYKPILGILRGIQENWSKGNT